MCAAFRSAGVVLARQRDGQGVMRSRRVFVEWDAGALQRAGAMVCSVHPHGIATRWLGSPRWQAARVCVLLRGLRYMLDMRVRTHLGSTSVVSSESRKLSSCGARKRQGLRETAAAAAAAAARHARQPVGMRQRGGAAAAWFAGAHRVEHRHACGCGRCVRRSCGGLRRGADGAGAGHSGGCRAAAVGPDAAGHQRQGGAGAGCVDWWAESFGFALDGGREIHRAKFRSKGTPKHQ